MKVRAYHRDVDWLASLDLTNGAYAVRDESIQVVRVSLPELDWVAFHFFAPVGHGFWWLRDDYSAYRSSAGRVFNVMRGNALDTPSVLRYEQVIGKLGIRLDSLHARLCFGLYPTLWGDRLGPKRMDGRIFGRYLSVVAPAGAADAVDEYFQQQIAEFGAHVVKAVDEKAKLYYTGSIPEYQRLLLVAPPTMLSDDQAVLVERALGEIIASPPMVESFGESLDPRVAFSGVSAITAGSNAQHGGAARIAELRVSLLCAMGWPHALDYARSEILGAARGSGYAALSARIDDALDAFPVVRHDPLSGVPQWHL